MPSGVVRLDRVKAIVFDKDGVLADSEAINIRSAFEVFARHGHTLRPEDRSRIVGRHPVDYVPDLAARFDLDEETQRTIIAAQDAYYTKTWRQAGRLLEGARAALAAARRTGLPVGLATSSSRQEVREFLERFDLAAAFDATLSMDDVRHAKPHPEIYRLAARCLKVRPQSMLVVEDSVHGVRAAKAAGAVCIAVDNPHLPGGRHAEADAHVASLSEVADLLASRSESR